MKKNNILTAFVICALSFLLLNKKGQTQNIGIGTISPTAKLHIFHNSSITNPQLLLYENSTDYSRLNFMNASGSSFWSIAGANSSVNSNARLNFYNSIKGDIMIITGDGNVGIGTNPRFPLTFPATVGDKISLSSDGTPTHFGFGIRTGLFQIFTKTVNDDIAFGYGSSSAFTETMRIRGNGNVGIGITNPQYQLDVADRMLLRNGPSGTAGLWLNKNDNSSETAFIGTYTDDNYIGFYGAKGAGWHFFMNTETGNVGIGNASPAYPLDVTGNSYTIGEFVNTSTGGDFYGAYASCSNIPGLGTGISAQGGIRGIEGDAILTGSGDRYGVTGFGRNGTGINCGIRGEAGNGGIVAYGIYALATGSPVNYAGYFTGNVYTTGSYLPSDRKLKNNIQPLNNAMSIINQLNPTVYSYKTSEYKQMQLQEGLHYGLIADEVLQVIPGLVKKAVQPAQYENHNEYDGKKLSDEVEFNAVNYSEMIPILIGGMKEQQVMIEKQQKQIDGLLKEIQFIKEKLK